MVHSFHYRDWTRWVWSGGGLEVKGGMDIGVIPWGKGEWRSMVSLSQWHDRVFFTSLSGICLREGKVDTTPPSPPLFHINIHIVNKTILVTIDHRLCLCEHSAVCPYSLLPSPFSSTPPPSPLPFPHSRLPFPIRGCLQPLYLHPHLHLRPVDPLVPPSFSPHSVAVSHDEIRQRQRENRVSSPTFYIFPLLYFPTEYFIPIPPSFFSLRRTITDLISS